VEDVYVYDMDTMEEMTAETRRLRSREIAGCEQMIREWVAETGDLLLRKQTVSHQKCAEK
jgi:glutamyl-tRNA reductase